MIFQKSDTLRATPATQSVNQIVSIQILRGIAATMVCFYHFTNGSPAFLPDTNLLKVIFGYGSYGVHIFFVISGFILTYSLEKVNYQYSDFPKFLLKRVIRLEPPYFICILLVIGLGFISTLSPYYRGAPFHFDFYNLLIHIGYLNAFFSQSWLNPVFWTLAIEFQFYLLLGLLYPFFKKAPIAVKYLVVISFLALSTVVTSDAFIFRYAAFFFIGIFGYGYFAKRISYSEFLLYLFAFLIFVFANFYLTGVVVGILAIAGIFYLKLQNRFLLYLGAISYSLYLLHVPIGMRVINLSEVLISGEPGRSVMVFAAFIVSLLASSLFFTYVEKVSLRFASRVKY